MSILDEALADAETVETEKAEVEALLGNKLVVFEVAPLDGLAWNNLTATHPPRPKAQQDTVTGFDCHGAVLDYPASALRVKDGDTVEQVTAEQWSRVARTLNGPDLDKFALTIWGVNVIEPNKRVRELKKASPDD